METACIITKNHFQFEEVDFKQLSSYCDNFIIEYNYKNNSYFKRSLFQLDKLEANIGILVNINDYDNIEDIYNDLINNIKGFNINLGVWIDFKARIKDFVLYNDLKKFNNNFITGFKNTKYKIIELEGPIWKENGDIDTGEYISFDFIRSEIPTAILYSDYKSIYKENNLKPIPSNYKI